jgi:integrase/recombinase XerD
MTGPARMLVMGPLAPFADGFGVQLAEQGYSRCSVQTHLRLVGHVSRWMTAEGLEVAQLTPRTVERLLVERRRQGHTKMLSPRGMRPLLSYLEALGVLPGEDSVRTPAELLLEDFRSYLLDERGLQAGSVCLYEGVARLFLAERSEPLGDDLARLSGAEINAFVLREARRRSVKSTETVVCALRSLLGFLHVQGHIPRSLVPAVPSVATRQSSLPRGLEAGQAARLLDSCDRDSALGRRDLAILKLLVRLGLRAEEVSALQLDDVNWRAGELLVRGKGPRLDRLPLASDVGEAIVDYLRDGRPRSACRQLFLRSRAPLGGLSSEGVSAVVRAACTRAGLAPVGAHRLRHTLASELLRAGASLPEIGQALRHRQLKTTAIYARVDRERLKTLALPWPEVKS